MSSQRAFVLIAIIGIGLADHPTTFAQQDVRPLTIAGAPSDIREATLSGPVFRAPEVFQGAEDYHNPRIQRFRTQYNFLEGMGAEPSEFRRILNLRNWVHQQWPVDNEQRFNGDAFAILEKARAGAGFHCAHSMTVQHAVLTAAGYVARNLGIDVDHRKFGRSFHHGINEVWSNEYARWVVLDAKYDIHFERDGLPLSALQLHEAVRRDGGHGVQMVRGPDRQPVPMGRPGADEATIESYWWISYHVRQNSLTQPHFSGGSWLVIPDNDAFRDDTWYRGAGENLGRHWAYAAGAFVPVANPHQIEWTPGVTSLARIEYVSDGHLRIQPRSATPNFKEYRCRVNQGPWRPLPAEDTIEWRLIEGTNTLEVLTRNLFDVDGPAATATIRYAP
jgi:hypothetical protein